MRSLLQNIALISLSLSLSVAGAPAPHSEALVKRDNLLGCDVDSFLGTLNWAKIKSQGAQFAYIGATEGITFVDKYFSRNKISTTVNKIIHGAYHFAHPDVSTGAAQATYFLAHGGKWIPGGLTLPGALILDDTCYGLTASQMVNWIQDFSTTYHTATTRYPVIYTATNWWVQCTDNSAAFASTNPLWIASFSSAVGLLPAGWSSYTFWNYADKGTFPGSQDSFNGDTAGLTRLALGT